MKTHAPSWQDKRILLTGGTSGLGLALAREWAARGAKVAIVARNRQGLEEATRDIPGLIAIQGDVSAKEDTYRISAEAIAALGGVDLLVNNASYLGATPLRLLLDTDCEDLARVLETNLVGAFRLTKAVLPQMVLRGRGVVLNISSDAGVSAYPRWGAYGASKAALAHLTRIWNEELRSQGVQLVAVDPGDMDTPMHAAAIPDADPATLLQPREAALRLIGILEAL